MFTWYRLLVGSSWVVIALLAGESCSIPHGTLADEDAIGGFAGSAGDRGIAGATAWNHEPSGPSGAGGRPTNVLDEGTGGVVHEGGADDSGEVGAGGIATAGAGGMGAAGTGGIGAAGAGGMGAAGTGGIAAAGAGGTDETACDVGASNRCVSDAGEVSSATCVDGSWVSTTCNYLCHDGVCTGHCTPNSKRCSATGVREVCNEAGEWQSDPPCGAGQVCVGAGECLAPPLIDTLTSDKAIAAPQALVRLQWTLSGGAPDSIRIDQEPAVPIAATESFTNLKPNTSGALTLRVANAAGEATRSVDVFLSPEGVIERAHSFGPQAWLSSLAVSPSGRVVSAIRPLASYTFGSITVDAPDAVLVEHLIEASTSSVQRLVIPDPVLGIADIAFDGEELIVVGEDVGNKPGSLPKSAAVARLDTNLQVIDSVTYRYGPVVDYYVATHVALGENREIFVAGYDNMYALSTLLQLDSHLDPPLVDDAVVGFELSPSENWVDMDVDALGRVSGLRLGELTVDVVPPVGDASPALGIHWTESATATALAIFPSGNRVVVGDNHASGGVDGYIQLVNGPSSVPNGDFYPPNLAGTAYDSIKFTDVCVNDASEIFVVGEAQLGSQRDLFVQAFRLNVMLKEAWPNPIIYGDPLKNEVAPMIECDPRGYVYVIARQDGVPFILKVR